MKIFPDIPKKGKPSNFLNTMLYFGFFTRDQIEEEKGKLLMLDIDFGRYCSLHCASCFRKSNVVDDTNQGDLTYNELLVVIDEARKLGLKSVKICGAGEPTQDSRFLKFVQDMTKRDIGIAVFTKGQVLGSDEETTKFYDGYGVTNALDLCQRLSNYNVSFMLSFQSFDTDRQDRLVGQEGHTFVRNRALENLAQAGFNNTSPTRLALELGPITRETYDEVLSIYTWARERNIYSITNPLMVSGKQIDHAFLKKYALSEQEMVELYTAIYSWNIENGFQTLKQIMEEGVSCMPGIHPCNQIVVGLYITANGNVVGCPGFTEIQGNVKTQNLKEIWENSPTRRIANKRFNCGCPPKEGITIPHNLYEQVLLRLKETYG